MATQRKKPPPKNSSTRTEWISCARPITPKVGRFTPPSNVSSTKSVQITIPVNSWILTNANKPKTKEICQNDCFLLSSRADGRCRRWAPQLPVQEMRHIGKVHQHAVVAQLSGSSVAQLAEPRRDGLGELLLQEVRHLGDEPQQTQLARLSGGLLTLLEPPRPCGRIFLPMQEMRPRHPQPIESILRLALHPPKPDPDYPRGNGSYREIGGPNADIKNPLKLRLLTN